MGRAITYFHMMLSKRYLKCVCKYSIGIVHIHDISLNSIQPSYSDKFILYCINCRAFHARYVTYSFPKP